MVENVAFPPESFTLPSVAPSDVIVTLPVGVALPELPSTKIGKLTELPWAAELVEADKLVADPMSGLRTVTSLAVEAESPFAPSPLYTAVRESVPAGRLKVPLADPSVSEAVPTKTPFDIKETDPVGEEPPVVLADQALERLSSLELVTSRYVSGRGRRTILWSAIDYEYTEPAQEDADEPGESSEEPN